MPTKPKRCWQNRSYEEAHAAFNAAHGENKVAAYRTIVATCTRPCHQAMCPGPLVSLGRSGSWRCEEVNGVDYSSDKVVVPVPGFFPQFPQLQLTVIVVIVPAFLALHATHFLFDQLFLLAFIPVTKI